ncbi:MAG: phage baseplate assembly protein V [Treponema sp.]|jgi:phage baseplate assembly protein gpV|nr:phage baseplate assembly protein V [Treponema sp.]
MFSNFYWATVTDNADPDELNRVKVLKEGEDESVADWIPVLTPYGSGDTGLSFLPDIDDQVLVVTLGTVDVRKAVIGSVWSNEVNPPQSGENSTADLNGDGENSLRFFRSRSGNQLIFDDTKDAEKIQLISADGESRIELSVADELVSLNTGKDISMGAKGAIVIKAEEIDISSEKQLNISVDEFQIDAKKGLDINTDKDMTIKGSGISLN